MRQKKITKTLCFNLFIVLFALTLVACSGGGNPTVTPMPAEPTSVLPTAPSNEPDATETAVPTETEPGYPPPLPTATPSDGSYPAQPTLAPPTAYPEP